jgi:O-antigen ligase
MIGKAAEKSIALLLSTGASAVALLVTSTINYDPVNVSKLILTAGIGFGIWAVLFPSGLRTLWIESRTLSIFAILFLFFGLVSLLLSPAPLSQNIFGVFGRNTGYLVYIALAGIMLGASLIRTHQYFVWLIRSVAVVGVINVIYCGIDIIGPDLIGWNNVYGNILGTFGNPNFISAFLGIFLVMSLGYFFSDGFGWKIKFISVLIAGVTFFEIVRSHAIQGIAVTGAGLAIIGFFQVRSKSKNSLFTWVYSTIVVVIGLFAVAGALQTGPLAQYIYKASVSLRGVYWAAGVKMGLENPLTGVGFDTYGDFYRQLRSAQAMITPGPQTVTNAAHNVVLDIFASGGFPLLLSYLAMITLASLSIFKVLRRTKQYDGVFVALAAGWVCYQVQSIVSINQIGLAIWGWLLTGAVIAYEKSARDGADAPVAVAPQTKGRSVKASAKTSGSLVLAPVLGFVVGVLVAFPPFAADAGWRSALKSGNAQLVYDAALRWPQDSYRFNSISRSLAENNLQDQALLVARKSIEFNPNSFDAWRVLATLDTSTEAEKAKATEMMRKLDPRNTNLE